VLGSKSTLQVEHTLYQLAHFTEVSEGIPVCLMTPDALPFAVLVNRPWMSIAAAEAVAIWRLLLSLRVLSLLETCCAGHCDEN
jgi:hypothetical protein